MNSDRNARMVDNVSRNDEINNMLVKSIFGQIVEVPIRDTQGCHTLLMSATESVIEWYFKIPVRYQDSSKYILVFTMNISHEKYNIMRPDIHHFQSSGSCILSLGTPPSVQSLPTKSLGLSGPITAHVQPYL